MKIISFSLWGKNLKYTIGAIKNAKLAKIIYPDWKCCFHIGNDVDQFVVDELTRLDCAIFKYDSSGWNGMFWRFFLANSNDVVISRDTDSRLNTREKLAVDEWLSSDKDFHIMRDHSHHGTEILGGMWGCRNGILFGIDDLINNYPKDNLYQIDQKFLKDVIYPKIYDNVLVHDDFVRPNIYYHPNTKSFPSNRKYNEYVGAPYDENDILLIPFI